MLEMKQLYEEAKAISEQLGFSSSIYFRKILAEQTGKTPRMIRKEREI